MINYCDLHDIWRIKYPNERRYTWYSNHNPPICCRLDYFLVSKHITAQALQCKIMPGYKSDHSVVNLKLDVSTIPRGPGSFKMNTLYLFEGDFKTNIKNAFRKLVRNIADSTPNSLWELIKNFVLICDNLLTLLTFEFGLSLFIQSI